MTKAILAVALNVVFSVDEKTAIQAPDQQTFIDIYSTVGFAKLYDRELQD